MKVLFLNPPFLPRFSRPQRSPAVTKSGTLYYPMWLCYGAGLLEREGHDVQVFDAPARDWDLERVEEEVKRVEADLIVMETSTPSIDEDALVASRLKDALPQSTLLLFGTHVTALPAESLEKAKGADAVVVGEMEMTVKEVAEKLEKGLSLLDTSGLVLRTEDERPYRVKARPLIEDLDALPFVSEVYERYLRIEDYFNPNALYPMVTIISSRGCPNRCTYCVYPQLYTGRRLRLRSVDNVVAEVMRIQERFPQARGLFFEDDTFTMERDRCIRLSKAFKEAGLRLRWTVNARVGLDYEALRAMKEGGCRLLCVGFESGDAKILKAIKKGIRPEDMERFMRDARRAGLLVHGCFMAGLPGETRETLERTLALAMRLNPDTAQFFPVMVYPGTEAYTWYEEEGLLVAKRFRDWVTQEGLHNCVVRTEGLSAKEIVDFCDYARRRFYLRPRYLLYKGIQSLRDRDEWKRNAKAARTLFHYLFRASLKE